MSKIRLLTDFESAITSDFTWRVREISDVRLLLKSSTGGVLSAALRASVPLLYAHWEGHVAVVARRYLDFLARRKFRYEQLLQSYSLSDLFQALKRISEHRLSVSDQVELIERVLAADGRQLRQPEYEIVSSKSNLNSDILKGICRYLAFDFALFESECDFIDKILIHRRNSIAHGEFMPINPNDFEDMSNRVIGLMRTFRNAADNMVQTEGYKRSVS